MFHRSHALMPVLAVAILACALPEALAHGVHAHPAPSEMAPMAPAANVGWWEATVSNVERQSAALFETARTEASIGLYLSVLLLAFGYGVLHAVGPGHGKVLLASYMTATRAPVALGIGIAVAAAALQAAIAIGVVLVVAIGITGATTAVPALQGAVNAVSLLLLAALGLLIVFRQLAALGWLPQPVARAVPASGCGCCSHGHGESHAHAHSHGHSHSHSHGHYLGHDHDHHHGHAPHHSHTAHDDRGVGDDENGHLATIGVTGLIASMGARPCTSAFAILLLALANNMLWLGIVAALAMALGVACTLILVAVFSVDLREFLRRSVNQSWLPQNAMSLVSLIAGGVLASVAFGGLVQAAAN